MYKSIQDIFNSTNAVINDPLFEIHNPVQKCNLSPEEDEYEEFLDSLDYKVYPKPNNKIIHNTVNPLHGSLKPVCIKL